MYFCIDNLGSFYFIIKRSITFYEGVRVTSPKASMPYDWLKHIPTALLQLDEIPLIGSSPPFPWEDLSKGLEEIFQIPDFKIEPTPFQWRTKDELGAGMGPVIPLSCSIPSLEGQLTWIMAAEDIYRLISLLLNEDCHEHDVLEDEFLQGFYYFAAYEVIHLINKLPFDQSLSPQILQESSMPIEDSLCMDIKIQLQGKTLIGRMIVSPTFRRSWKEKYAERSLELPLHASLAEQLTIPVHIEAGRTSIHPSEWKTVRKGDFILLDSCTVKPYDDKGGRITLTVNGIPFFIGKIKDGNIKILDHPLYYQEEETFMSKIPSEEQDDSSLDFESELEFDSEMESDMESDFDSEMEAEDESEEASNLASNEKLKDREIEEELTSSEEQSSAVIPTETSVKIDEIPLSIIIEVGRLQMSVKKMLELQPGNLLELDVHPENGVDLVVNGRRIAKGELIRLGEALGVRILDIS
ncbi:putative flagellar motor switch protein [Neochlamydia sp. TUME1]|nr:putative flagellar motor switch protein [Neochlamydia sp. TUME1]